MVRMYKYILSYKLIQFKLINWEAESEGFERQTI